ncbi:MAG: lytic transglycosylase domain-containing protein, partial [Dehalococcoidia bacterium]
HQVFSGGEGALSAPTYDPTAFAAILERSGDVQQPLPAAALLERPAAGGDPSTIAGWMATAFGPRSGQPAPADATRSLELGFELLEAEDTGVARTLLYRAIAGHADRPYDLLDIAQRAMAAEQYDLQVDAAGTILRALTPEQQMSAPNALLRLAYPAHFLAQAQAGADESGVPVLLLLALVRQESAFNPTAGSHAGARGLAQFIPSTAADVLQALGHPMPLEQALDDPGMSLRMGAYYLAQQIRAFDGNVVPALAGYNGGPGNARRWLDAHHPRNTDGYVWSVDFAETRLYLDRVLSNYAWYRYIYADAPLAVR